MSLASFSYVQFTTVEIIFLTSCSQCLFILCNLSMFFLPLNRSSCSLSLYIPLSHLCLLLQFPLLHILFHKFLILLLFCVSLTTTIITIIYLFLLSCFLLWPCLSFQTQVVSQCSGPSSWFPLGGGIDDGQFSVVQFCKCTRGPFP